MYLCVFFQLLSSTVILMYVILRQHQVHQTRTDRAGTVLVFSLFTIAIIAQLSTRGLGDNVEMGHVMLGEYVKLPHAAKKLD